MRQKQFTILPNKKRKGIGKSCKITMFQGEDDDTPRFSFSGQGTRREEGEQAANLAALCNTMHVGRTGDNDVYIFTANNVDPSHWIAVRWLFINMWAKEGA